MQFRLRMSYVKCCNNARNAIIISGRLQRYTEEYIMRYMMCTSQQNAGDILEYQISQISQRPDAPQGSTSPLEDTGSPISSAVTVPSYFSNAVAII